MTPPSVTPYEFIQRDRGQHPPAFTPDYKSTVLRSPRRALWSLDTSLSEVTSPRFGHDALGPLDHDLILNYAQGGEPIGERTVVHGWVLDKHGRGIPHTLIEVWQANAGGRYRHVNDTYLAPIDPNFGGCGRVMTGTTPSAPSSPAPTRSATEPTPGGPRTSISRCSGPAWRRG